MRVLPLKTSPVCGACRTPTPRQTTAFTCVFRCFPCDPSCGSASWATPEFTPRSAAPMVKMTRSKTFQAYCLLATGPTAAFTAEPTWPITMNLFPRYLFAAGPPCRPRGRALLGSQMWTSSPKGPGTFVFLLLSREGGSAWLSHSKLRKNSELGGIQY